MTGLGFFSIELDTLTAMLSISLTYIIILLQFNVQINLLYQKLQQVKSEIYNCRQQNILFHANHVGLQSSAGLQLEVVQSSLVFSNKPPACCNFGIQRLYINSPPIMVVEISWFLPFYLINVFKKSFEFTHDIFQLYVCSHWIFVTQFFVDLFLVFFPLKSNPPDICQPIAIFNGQLSTQLRFNLI